MLRKVIASSVRYISFPFENLDVFLLFLSLLVVPKPHLMESMFPRNLQLCFIINKDFRGNSNRRENRILLTLYREEKIGSKLLTRLTALSLRGINRRSKQGKF